MSSTTPDPDTADRDSSRTPTRGFDEDDDEVTRRPKPHHAQNDEDDCRGGQQNVEARLEEPSDPLPFSHRASPGNADDKGRKQADEGADQRHPQRLPEFVCRQYLPDRRPRLIRAGQNILLLSRCGVCPD